MTWDRSGELLPACMTALAGAHQEPFGVSGARVRSVAFSTIQAVPLDETPNRADEAALRIRFVTPIRIKHMNRWVSERELSLEHLAIAAARRLNGLSRFHGSGKTIDPAPFIQAARDAVRLENDLLWVRPRRYSSTQDTELSLSGVVGYIRCQKVPPPLMSLLTAPASSTSAPAPPTAAGRSNCFETRGPQF